MTRVSTIAAVGTVLWLLAAAALLVAQAAGADPPALAITTCFAGAGLGGAGWSLFAWQRAAARRGSRTAQPGVDA